MSRFTDAAQALLGSKALPDGAPAPNLYGYVDAIGRRISNRAAPRHTEAYGGREAIDTVWECVNMYANTAAHADYYFERDDRRLVSNPRSPDYKGLGYSTADPDLVTLFKYPNRREDYSALLKLSIIDLLLAGEFFWFKNRVNGLEQPKELYRVAPSLVDVIPGRVAPEGYWYNPPNDEPMRWAPEEVIHVKLPNPHDPWRGLGMISANPTLFDTALGLDEAIRQYYEQGTRLTGVLESDRSIPKTTWDKIKREFVNLYSGRMNAYKVALLERGLKFQSISGNADEAQFSTAQGDVFDRIARVFSVPTPLLGDVGGSTDRQAVREAQRIFDNKVMRPFLDSLQAAISAQLTVPAWDGVEWCIEYEYVMPIEDKLSLATQMASGPVTVREWRAQIDLEPLGDHRDDLLVMELLAPLPAPADGQPPPSSGTAPYPPGAKGRTGEPTTADGSKADPAVTLADRLALMREEIDQ